MLLPDSLQNDTSSMVLTSPRPAACSVLTQTLQAAGCDVRGLCSQATRNKKRRALAALILVDIFKEDSKKKYSGQ